MGGTSTVTLPRALARWLSTALPLLACVGGKSAPARHVAGFCRFCYGLAHKYSPARCWRGRLLGLALGWFAPGRAGGWAAWRARLIWATRR
ncbi:MAG: hypothetical protein R3E18_10260 [Sphingomonadaceae bacterium]